MKLRNPYYLTYAAAVSLLLAAANHNGWSLIQSLTSGVWHHTTPNTQHK